MQRIYKTRKGIETINKLDGVDTRNEFNHNNNNEN